MCGVILLVYVLTYPCTLNSHMFSLVGPQMCLTVKTGYFFFILFMFSHALGDFILLYIIADKDPKGV